MDDEQQPAGRCRAPAGWSRRAVASTARSTLDVAEGGDGEAHDENDELGAAAALRLPVGSARRPTARLSPPSRRRARAAGGGGRRDALLSAGPRRRGDRRVPRPVSTAARIVFCTCCGLRTSGRPGRRAGRSTWSTRCSDSGPMPARGTSAGTRRRTAVGGADEPLGARLEPERHDRRDHEDEDRCDEGEDLATSHPVPGALLARRRPAPAPRARSRSVSGAVLTRTMVALPARAVRTSPPGSGWESTGEREVGQPFPGERLTGGAHHDRS